MKPLVLGKKYDKIAQWWHDRHHDSTYGVEPFQRAISYAAKGGKAMDVGCGAGGRFVRILQSNGFQITGLDVSQEMVRLAALNHPDETFLHQDICSWETADRYDFIVAWDSIFHLPLDMQRPVVTKLCQLLADDGVVIYTFGNDAGAHESEWLGDSFYYSSIGIADNVGILLENGLTLMHLELDQYPEKHVYVIAKKQSRLAV